MTQESRQSWTIGIMCYNEAETIERAALLADEILKEISNGDYEILIVDDGSTDGSREKIKSVETRLSHVKAILHERNKGIGEALRTVYTNASKENVIVTPGDCQFDYTELRRSAVLSDDEFVSFFRKENTTYSSYRVVLSLLNKMLNRLLIGFFLQDVNWTKAYKTKIVRQLDLQLHSSLIESEICAKLFYLGFKVREVESKFLPRIAGVSKGGSWKIVKKAISDIAVLMMVMRKFKSKYKLQNGQVISKKG